MSTAVDPGGEKRDELIFEMVKESYKDEGARGEKLYEQARGLVGSVLVGIGFLLAAGTIELVRVESATSFIYLTGVGLLISSIITAFTVLRIKTYASAVNVEHLLREYTGRSYEYVMKRTAVAMAQSLITNQETNNLKAKTLMIAWYLLIMGLIVVLLFVVVSILFNANLVVNNPPSPT